MKKMPYIIAEIGFNHEGDITVAKNMIKAAAEAGANAVKFQTFKAHDIALPSSEHYAAITHGEINLKQHQVLSDTACTHAIDFISTPFSRRAVDLLEKLDVPAYKISSMDCTNTYLLDYVAQTNKPVYLSTGMSSPSEIADSLVFLKKCKSGPVTLLHCVSCYPATAAHLNLEIIPYLKQLFNLPIGYSDHYPGIDACFVAAMLGAEVLETHFTLDPSRPDGDHSHSATPQLIKQLIRQIKIFTKMRGTDQAVYSKPDRYYAQLFRRGVYAAKPLKKGSKLKLSDCLLCRPTSILTPNDIPSIKGKVLIHNVAAFEPLDILMFA